MDDKDLLLAAAAVNVIIAGGLYILDLHTDNPREEPTVRRCWVSELMRERAQFGAFNSTLNTLEIHDVEKWRNYLRMEPHLFNAILQSVGDSIRRQDTVLRAAIPPAERLALTLRYLATGESFTSLHFQFRIGKSTVAEIIPDVCEAIYNCLKQDYLSVPSTTEQWKAISTRFHRLWNFPNCLGALDGKHIVMRKPWHAGSAYHNYKESESIVLMALVDADYK